MVHLLATSTHDFALQGIEPSRTNCTYDTRTAYSEVLSTWADVDPDTAPSAGVMDLRSLAILELSTYTPNGARENLYVAPSPAPLEPIGFTGKESDEELGMTYFGERWLIPKLGRWTSPDPLHVHASGGGEALNSYHYVSGNLLQARDPLGLDIKFVHRTTRGQHSEAHQQQLASAIREALPQLQNDLWNHLAIGAVEVADPSAVATLRHSGGEGRLSDSSSHLYRVRSEVWNRAIVGGGTRADAQAAVTVFDQARARMIGYLREGDSTVVELSTLNVAATDSLAGAEHGTHGRSTFTVFNPLYVRSLQGSERARTPFGTLFLLYHEWVHMDGPTGSGGLARWFSATADSSMDPESAGADGLERWSRAETATTADVDRVLAACDLPVRGAYDDPDVIARRLAARVSVGFDRVLVLRNHESPSVGPERVAAPEDPGWRER